jgi:hypothetical protein
MGCGQEIPLWLLKWHLGQHVALTTKLDVGEATLSQTLTVWPSPSDVG